jgi:hypothetical protein
MWCISEINKEFRKRMYDILDLYEKPYDPRYPVIGLDEKPKQLLEDKRKAIPMKPGYIEKYDNQYIRRGNANVFMAVEFKAGKRTARVTSRRTKRDFAKFIRHLVDRIYPEAKCLQLVLDNLNTHNESALYEMYSPEEAERILGKIEFHYTPVHASWLNVAEIEIGVMDTECTRRRIPDKKTLRKEVIAWSKRRNEQSKKIDWRFTKQKADEKLSAYYVT